ncbi:MAG: phosphomannose isomerase type II C-terminal cupin domain [Thermoproteota archaeon]
MRILTDNRPWGFFEQFTLNEKSTIKILHVFRGKRLSKQYHTHREEFWRILKGFVQVHLGERELYLNAGESITIPAGTTHRVKAIEDAMILEISFGHFDESDIVRVEDDFGRESPKSARQSMPVVNV